MKKIILTVFAATMLIFSSTQAFALFSFSVGVPISQNFTASNADGSMVAESEGVSGVFLHASLPILVGLGVENYKTTIKNDTPLVLSTTMYDIFYLLPIPIINLTLGLGTGTTEHECIICSSKYDKGTPTQWYASLGVPFFPFFDVHVSYRSITSKMSVKAAYGGGEVDLSGNVTGVGIMFGF